MKHRIKNFVSLIIAVSMLLSLIPFYGAAIDSLPNSDLLELKELISQALQFGDTMRNYFPNIAKWIEEYNYYHEVDLPQYTDTLIKIDNKIYLLLYENLLSGGSYQNFINYAYKIFTENIAQKATTQAYLQNHLPLFYISDKGDKYIASPETLTTHYFFDEYTSQSLELIDVQENYAVGRICLYITHVEDDQTEYELFHQYPAWVECKFVKTNDGWKIDESAFTDMITSTRFDREYCSKDNLFSPSTADPAGINNELNAEQLVREALYVYYHHAYEIYLDLGIRGEKKNEKPDIDNSHNYDIFDPSKLIGGSLDSFYNHLGTIYTDYLAQKYTQTGYLLDSPMFIIEDDGDVFKVWEAPMKEKFNRLSFENATAEIIENDGKRARAKVYLEIYDYELESTKRTSTDAWVECIFENTSTGWRISECAFFDMLNSHKSNFEWTPVDSPYTADPAFNLVFILPTVSVAAIASAFCLMRRRRENVL